MDLIERIDELQVLVEEAKSVPFSSSALIDREEFLELLAQLKQEIPDEIRQARWIARDRDEVLERHRKEAEDILLEAREQRDRLLSRTEIVHAAQREADKITAGAKERAAARRIEADDYIDQKLAAFEILLTKTLATIARGREQLQGDVGPAATAAFAEEQRQPPGPFDAAELTRPAEAPASFQ